MPNIFDILTEKYDAWYDSDDGRPLHETELLCLGPLIENTPLPILEVGVGTGRFAMHFHDVMGVDPAFNALRFAQKRGIIIAQSVGEHLPFRDTTFGCVLLVVTLCFVQNPVDVLREAKRVSNKNGRIIIGLVPMDSPWSDYYEEKKRRGHPFYRSARFYTLEGVKELLQKAGLKISRIRSTLLQGPDEPHRVEEPIEGYIKNAGFLCIEAKPGN